MPYMIQLIIHLKLIKNLEEVIFGKDICNHVGKLNRCDGPNPLICESYHCALSCQSWHNN